MIIDHKKLHALTNRIVVAGGSSPAEAAIVAEHLVEANLRGHDSHGVGMLVAYLTSITVLPALLYVLHPPGEQDTLGITALAPVDDFLERHRIAIIVATLGVAIAGLPLLYFLRFDFNPMNLRSAKVESVATYLDLRRDPATGANSINMLAASPQAADEMAQRLKASPQVGTVRTIDSFIPADQEAKLALIAAAAKALDPVLALPARPAPTDTETVEALELRADANLVLGILGEAADLRSQDLLPPMKDRFVAAAGHLNKAAATLKDPAIAKLAGELVSIGKRDGNIFELKEKEFAGAVTGAKVVEDEA